MPIDGRAVNDHLRKALAEQAALAALARRAVRAAAPDPPPPGCGLAVRGDPGGLAGWRRRADGSLVLWLTDAGGTGTAAGGLVALLVQALLDPEASPAANLGRVNRALLDLAADPAPLVGLGVVHFDPASGEATVARGGLPPAVVVRPDGTGTLAGPGPFLGAFAAAFDEQTVTLAAGDRLILATGPVTPRDLPADGLAYALAGDLASGPAGGGCLVVGFP